MSWPRRLILWLFLMFVIMANVCLPILNYETDHIIEVSDRYRGVSVLGLCLFALWLVLYFHYLYLTSVEQYRKEREL